MEKFSHKYSLPIAVFLFAISVLIFSNQVTPQPITTNSKSFTPRIRLKNGTSLNWAGYAVATNLSNPQNGAVTDVKGSWTIPSMICPSGTAHSYSATWIGIDGDTDNTVEQTGTEQDCVNGQPQYYAWYEMYPRNSVNNILPVKPGDVMSAEVKYLSGGVFQLTLTDTTSNQFFTSKQKLGSAKRQSAEWIVEAPWAGGILPLANFGTQTFSGAQATLNTHTGTISDSVWQNDQIIMTNSAGIAKATPSSLDPTGSNFSVVWNSSN